MFLRVNRKNKTLKFTSCGGLRVLAAQELLASLLARALFLGCTVQLDHAYLPARLPACSPARLLAYPPARLLAYPPARLLAYLPTCPPARLPAYLPTCQSYLLACMPTRPNLETGAVLLLSSFKE